MARDDLMQQLATLALRKHYYCEDAWYSCPKHPDGCSDDSVGQDCNCGADEHNASVHALLEAARDGREEGEMRE